MNHRKNRETTVEHNSSLEKIHMTTPVSLINSRNIGIYLTTQV